MTLEHPIQRRIMLALNRGPVRLFRVNAGTAWQGDKTFTTLNGERVLIIRNYRKIQLADAGIPDLVGWRTIPIEQAQAMGLRIVGQFVGMECKAPGKRPSATQRAVLDGMNRAGCLGVWADSEEMAIEQVVLLDE